MMRSVLGTNGWGVRLLAVASRVVVGVAVLYSAGNASAVPPGPPTKYSLAGGCFALRSSQVGRFVRLTTGPSYVADARTVSEAEPFRLQPADLRKYILYGRNRDVIVPFSDGSVEPTVVPTDSAPTGDAVWIVSDSGRGQFTLTDDQTGQVLGASGDGTLGASVGAPIGGVFSFVQAKGCSTFPEAAVSAAGTVVGGPSPMAEVTGTVDAHAHITAFEFLGGQFHCGRPWSPLGVAAALPDCGNDQSGPALLLFQPWIQRYLDWGDPVAAPDTVQWPTFVDYPNPNSVSTEGDYYISIKRAWMAGLRLIVSQDVNNEALCAIMVFGHPHAPSCDDWQSVRKQHNDLHRLQDYIDALSGGPGKGWFRIVTNPFDARRVINAGKLAVVEGVEASDVLSCGNRNSKEKRCHLYGPHSIDERLTEMRKLGIATFFPVHKFDNVVGGTRMDQAPEGVLIDLANQYLSRHFWNVGPCPNGGAPKGEESDTPYNIDLSTLDPTVRTAVETILNTVGSPIPPASVGSPPFCNQTGLSPVGRFVISDMIRHHLLIEIDHMDVITGKAALKIIEQKHYSGVISGHGWDTPGENREIYSVGGFVAPDAAPDPDRQPARFVAQWLRDARDPHGRYLFGLGYGSDMNGLAQQPMPGPEQVQYPFKSLDGRVSFWPEQWGQATFDFNPTSSCDPSAPNAQCGGVSNYGMYADWLEAVRVQAGHLRDRQGNPIMSEMSRGAEAYLETWERAEGVRSETCLPPQEKFGPIGFPGTAVLGDDFERLLLTAGQPNVRTPWSYRYCVSGQRAGSSDLRVAFVRSGGRIGLIASSALAAKAAGIAVGTPAGRLSTEATVVRPGVWLSRTTSHGARYIFGTRSGVVAYVGVVSAAASSPPTLYTELSSAGL